MISIHNLYKAFEEKIVFENYQLEIPDNRFVVISGNSGCGKTTLLHMIGGIEKPDKGNIIVDHLDLSLEKNKGKYYRDVVGFLFQNFALIENKTVRQNLELIQKKGRSGVSAEEALAKVDLLGLIDKKVYKLSGGEQQRVALARLMMKKCSVILADEPTGSLDEKNSDIVMEVLHQMHREGKTVIIVTHSKKIVEAEEYVIYL